MRSCYFKMAWHFFCMTVPWILQLKCRAQISQQLVFIDICFVAALTQQAWILLHFENCKSKFCVLNVMLSVRSVTDIDYNGGIFTSFMNWSYCINDSKGSLTPAVNNTRVVHVQKPLFTSVTNRAVFFTCTATELQTYARKKIKINGQKCIIDSPKSKLESNCGYLTAPLLGK